MSRIGSAAQKTNRHSFHEHVTRSGHRPLARGPVTTVQVNVGKRCNQACHHCHVGAGPKRTEIMSRAVAERIVGMIDASEGIEVLDLTGGAPELNPHFRWLVTEARSRGLQVLDRCNLTILSEPGQEDLADFLADHAVRVVASLPCYTSKNVDAQRGRGVFERSIAGLRQLNALGYGAGNGRSLDLVYNPGGPFLPPAQAVLQADYTRELDEHFGLRFDDLLTITNLPIARFADSLHRTGRYDEYMSLLIAHFNPATLSGVMCRSLVSVGYDGQLFDCDFNQMLEIPLGAALETGTTSVFSLESFDELAGRRIATDSHCFGCTAGAGSSCGGALD